MPQSKTKTLQSMRVVLAAFLVLLGFAVTWVVWSQEPADWGSPLADSIQADPNRPDVASADAGSAQPRQSVAYDFVWRAIDDSGAPVLGAIVTIDGVDYPCDSLGEGRASLRKAEIEASARCLGHLPWSGRLISQASTDVVLRRCAAVELRVVDELSSPVEGATVWLADRWGSLEAMEKSSHPRAVTNAAGIALVGGVPYGKRCIHVGHPVLVFSHDGQDAMEGRSYVWEAAIAIVPSGPVVVKLAMPQVIAFEPPDGQPTECSVRGPARGWSQPSNADGQDALNRRTQELRDRFPKATVVVMMRAARGAAEGRVLPAMNPSTTGYSHEIRIRLVGKALWTQGVSPIPFDQFEKPLRIDASVIADSSDFGSVIVKLAGLPDGADSGVRAYLSSAEPKGDPVPQRAFAIDSLEPFPVGEYKLKFFDPLLDALARKMPPFSLTAGEIRTLEVGGEDTKLVRVRLVAVDPPAENGVYRVSHPTIGKTSWGFVRIGDGIEVLVPEGEVVTTLSYAGPVGDTAWEGLATTVVASGPTRTILHTLKLKRKMENGDMVEVDPAELQLPITETRPR